MRVALVSPYDYPYPGGVTEHISELDRQLRRMGHRVKIIASSSIEDADLDENIIRVSKTIVPVPYSGSIGRLSLSPQLLLRVRDILLREPFDIIHIHEPTIPLLSLAVLRASRSVNIGTFHAYRQGSATYEISQRFLRPFFDRLHGRIAVSQAARDYIGAYFPGDYRIIPNGINVARFANDAVQPVARFSGDGKLNILFMGRLETRKGFRYLLRAFRSVKAAVPQARLLVAGAYSKEDKRSFVQYARHFHLHDVKFVGYVSGDEKPCWYRTAHIFCAPSTGFESFGLVLLEAMASGVPVVASDIAGYRDVLQDGVQGDLVPPEDEEALAEALIRLLRDPKRRAAYADAGRQTAPRYDWSLVSRQVFDFYREILAGRREVAVPAADPQYRVGQERGHGK
ncbi:MAG TPA: glycosyltransferase family 4 protein [Ardenticatenaceae bacterium]|nr:glycosyltransferase family 4 protein [Ardenticatenaceae bacterium]